MDQNTLILLGIEGGLILLGTKLALKVAGGKKRKQKRASGFSRQEHIVHNVGWDNARRLVDDYFYRRPSRLVLGMNVPAELRRKWWHVTAEKQGILHSTLRLDSGSSMDVLVTCQALIDDHSSVMVRFAWNLKGEPSELESMKEIAVFTGKRLLANLQSKAVQMQPPAPPPMSDTQTRIRRYESVDAAIPRDWPSPQDYNEAVQCPTACFKDSDLQAAEPELTTLGIPRVVSGGFANVYRLNNADNDSDLAVRCFVVPVKDQEERYQAISEFLLGSDLRCTVSFEYLEEGIKVRGKWYPAVKMDWIEGMPLNLFVDKHLGTPAIPTIRDKFRQMVRTMRAWGIAHGDLQHGNIMVCEGELFLVDYDAMYVPALQGYVSNEIGHPNFQHPSRDAKDFGPWLDHFSCWVIDTALLCLEHDPDLWKQFNGGDENLLFRQTDFLNPAQSKLFDALASHRSIEVRERCEFLLSLLGKPPKDVPALVEGRTKSNQPEPEAKIGSHERSSALPDWLSNDDALSTDSVN